MSNFRFNLCDISLSMKEEKVPYIRQNIYRLPPRYIKHSTCEPIRKHITDFDKISIK